MANIYLFTGNNTREIFQKKAEWQKKFAEKYGENSIKEINSNGSPLKVSEFASDNSLFSSKVLYVVEDPFSSGKKKGILDEADFLEFLEINKKNDNHVLLVQKQKLDKRLKFTKEIFRLGKAGKIKIYEIENLNETEALKFFAKELAKENKKINKDAGELLFSFISRQGELDSWQAINCLQQLVHFADSKDVIEAADVTAVIPPGESEDVFLPLLNSFSKKNSTEFLNLFNDLVENTDNEQELLGVVSAIFNQIKNMLLVKDLKEEGKNIDQIDELLNFKKGRSRYVLRDAENFSREDLNDYLEKIMDIEFKVKQGKIPLAPAIARII